MVIPQFVRMLFSPTSVENKETTNWVDGCGLANDTSSITWSRFSADEVDSFKVLKGCVMRTTAAKPDMVRPLEDIAKLTVLQCHQKVTQSTIQSVVQQSKTIWFIGDSILEQQFYVFLCMVNPSLTRDEIRFSSISPGHPLETIAAHSAYNHTMGTTEINYSKFGLSFHPKEGNLYVDAFPKAVASLTDKDSIVLDASAHYNSENSHKLESVLNFIGEKKSQFTNASIFLMESTPEEWPTSNGMFTKGCMWNCTCETLNAARTMGTRQSLGSQCTCQRFANTLQAIDTLFWQTPVS